MQGLLGTILCEGQKNEGVIPINKNLWYVDQSWLLVAVWWVTDFLDIVNRTWDFE